MRLLGGDNARRFDTLILPHLPAAYNLARWLVRNKQDAEDVVQESCLRAFRAFSTFQTGRDAKPWLLTIVRNTGYSWLRQNRPAEVITAPDDLMETVASVHIDAETALIEKANAAMLRQAMEEVATEYREVLILRELEGLSYKEIAQVGNVPIGTVMSRLSRGRRELETRLIALMQVKP